MNPEVDSRIEALIRHVEHLTIAVEKYDSRLSALAYRVFGPNLPDPVNPRAGLLTLNDTEPEGAIVRASIALERLDYRLACLNDSVTRLESL